MFQLQLLIIRIQWHNSMNYSACYKTCQSYPKARLVFNVPLVSIETHIQYFQTSFILLLPAVLDDASFDIMWLYQAMVWSPMGWDRLFKEFTGRWIKIVALSPDLSILPDPTEILTLRCSRHFDKITLVKCFWFFFGMVPLSFSQCPKRVCSVFFH